MMDRAAIKATISNLYKAISSDENKMQDWILFRSLFENKSILIENKNGINRIFDILQFENEMKEAFIKNGELLKNGFQEKEIDFIIYQNRNNAFCVSKYKKNYMINNQKFDQIGENYIQLCKNKNEWKIISIMWNE